LCQNGHGVKEEASAYGSKGVNSDFDFDFDFENAHSQQTDSLRFTCIALLQASIPLAWKALFCYLPKTV
jgi:hypothetical protein